VQPDWNGFGVRLGRAISRWQGGSQRAFAEAMAKHKKRHRVVIPTSYRTLLNYLSGATHPSVAWVEAAAAVLRWNPENLLYGTDPERLGEPAASSGIRFSVTGEAAHRTSALVHLILNEYFDLPMEARNMMFGFAGHYYADDLDGWEKWQFPENPRRKEVQALLREHFAPLLSAPRMGELELMALAASLTAAAYLRLAGAHNRKEN
jgi:hypothetical protein